MFSSFIHVDKQVYQQESYKPSSFSFVRPVIGVPIDIFRSFHVSTRRDRILLSIS